MNKQALLSQVLFVVFSGKLGGFLNPNLYSIHLPIPPLLTPSLPLFNNNLYYAKESIQGTLTPLPISFIIATLGHCNRYLPAKRTITLKFLSTLPTNILLVIMTAKL